MNSIMVTFLEFHNGDVFGKDEPEVPCHEFHNGDVFGKDEPEVPCQRPYESLTGGHHIDSSH